MELDKRIEKLSDILACVNVEEANQFVGQKGYFGDNICLFKKLEERIYDVLSDTGEDDDMPFIAQESHGYWRYFLPECRLKPEEKKYRPYTIEEFLDIFPIGHPIKFRYKEDKLKKVSIFLGYETLASGDTTIEIGICVYSLKELFEKYELQKFNEEEWQPFGVEVEE